MSNQDAAIKFLTKLAEELKKGDIMPSVQVMETDTPNPGYQGCECPTCLALNCDCEHCPVCSENDSMEENPAMPDAETQMAMYDSSIGKVNKSIWGGTFDPRSGL